MASSEGAEERLRAALADHYRIEHEIGSGGMATVYLAEDLKHPRQVAIKVLEPDLAQTLGAERFLREIETVASLTHPHILPLHDSGEAGGFLFYVMPYVKGESLRARLTNEGQLPVDEAVAITLEIADALAYAHREGVIHRDVKPANIMLEEGHAVLADFGVAHAVAEAKDERITRTGTSLGTPAYMSPEQASGEQELDGRSDQYALGCVLYEMLAGQPPFTGVQVESVIRQHLTADPPDVTQLRPTVPPGVAEALAKSLAKSPADRFQTTGEFGRVLDAELHTPSGGVAATPARGPRTSWLRKLAAVVGAGTALLLAWQAWVGDADPAAAAGPRPWTILAVVEGSAPEEIRSTVRRLLAGEIDESGILATLSDQQVGLGLEQAMMPDTTRITSAVARELAVRGGVETVFSPELDLVGTAYALRVRVLHAERDSVLAVEQETVENENALIPAAADVVARITRTLSDRTGQVPRPGESAITPSFEAFQKWRTAVDLYYQLRHAEAISLFREAIELDPDLAPAWVRMGVALYVLGFRDSARAAVDEGLARPERLTGSEGLFAEYMHYWQMGDRPQEVYQIAERAVREYPSDRTYNQLALALVTLGRPDEAVEMLQELEARSPFGLDGVQTTNLALWLSMVGEFQEARLYASRHSDRAVRAQREMEIASSAAEWDEAEQKALELLRSPDASLDARVTSWESLAAVHAVRGRIDNAYEALRQYLELATSPPQRLRALRFMLTLSAASASTPEEFGGSPLPSDTTDTGRELAALWSLYRGDLYRASEVAVTIGEPDPDDPSLIPGLDAGRLLVFSRLAAAEGRWDVALRLLRSQIGQDRWIGFQRDPRFLVEWTAAEALENLGIPDSSVIHFERLVDPVPDPSFWRTLQWRGLTHSFAHRRAALLHGQLGNRDKAIEHWRVFLNDFTDPDPELEWMVEEARAELVRLEG